MFKQLMCAVMVLFTSASLNAQDKTSGVIYYKQVTQLGAGGMRITMGGGAGDAAPAMPQKITTEYEFTFNANGAKFQRYVSNDAGSGGMMIMAGGAERKAFYDFTQNKVSEYIPLDGDNYIMESKLGSASDTVQKTDETKTIIGFNCKKAIIKNKAGTTEIWYTTDLKFNASPAIPYWTEGVVLALQNNRMSYTATSVEYYKVKDKDLAMPKDGKLITAEEYKSKMDEFMKKLQSGGGRTFRMGN